ncbi:MAG: hypothetical protein WC824_13815 [Bacteroidota bacterium]|jgi:G:T-mismatch repair DNA endonuclease (very short patch repair protein)
MAIFRHCPVCGVPYEADPARLKYGRQTTCSRKCSYSLRGKKSSKGPTPIAPCAVCGIPTSRGKSKSGIFLCSPKCHYQARGLGLVKRIVHSPYQISTEIRSAAAETMRKTNAARKASNGYGCSLETRAKISIGVAKAISEGRIPRVSKLEKTVGEILSLLGVRFAPQFHIRDTKGRFGAVVDFFLLDSNTALEINGTFWHADPRAYPSGPQHLSQKRTANQYALKMQFLKSLGIPVLELWEIDLRNNLEGSVRSLLNI